MARRGHEAAAKRARETRREQQREDKRARREALAEQADTIPPADEEALMEAFAKVSAAFAEERISEATYLAERHRIFVALGIEPDDPPA